MRIISGKLRGKKISFLKTKITRPLKDSVRESIFNVLAHSNEFNINIADSNVLDLYSGVGSFGLECISREAKFVTFIEKNRLALDILKKNLNDLSLNNQAQVISGTIENFLKLKQIEKYKILFFDPPFADNEFIQNLKIIREIKIFERDHIIIIHRERKTENNFDNILHIIKKKEYGRSEIFFAKFI